ncbi:hypothetical protein [Streptomyces hirsutus]|uniref:hypothetical protein n=1 Tax=Streptomyces hirsutus TaxID=35620 RepID=UPI0006E26263|nr:hypothetical protein [Streptomyces hirsutus]
MKKLALRPAKNNPRQGRRQIQGELARPGHSAGARTVQEIQTAAGSEPTPRHAGPTWRESPPAQAENIIACDFLHLNLVDLRRVHALVSLEHSTRRLRITGVTAHPTGSWTVRQARNLAVESGVRIDSPHLLVRDRDTKYTVSFDAAFAAEGIEVVRTAPRAPRMNTHRERGIKTLPREALDHLLIRNETRARHVLDAYARHHQPATMSGRAGRRPNSHILIGGGH